MQHKDNVYKSYEKIAGWFDEHRSRELFEKAWLDKALKLLPQNVQVLDLGCGMGEPIIPYLLKNGAKVTGIDGSTKLIDLAKSRLSEVEFIVSDMRGLELGRKFDLIIAWHSIFHLSREDQIGMFATFASHLKQGGALLFTSGEFAGEIWSDNGGEELYHASLSPHEYQDLLKQGGFELIERKISDPECGDATVWLAKLAEA